MMTLKLESLFNQKAFDRIFIRQRDDVSCVPASFATLARLYDLPESMDYAFFRKELKVSFNGTYPDSFHAGAKDFLPVVKAGIDVYDGGIALGGIRHKPEGDNHAVVFLARRNGVYIYYDPCEHVIYRDHARNMQRGDTPIQAYRWTANMPPIKGAGFSFWKKLSVDNPYPLRSQVFWLKENGQRKFRF